MTAAVDISEVDFSYGAIRVLENLTLSIEEEEFFGIIGPNASGKTTLLKLILGLEKPGRGRIRVLGEDPRKMRGKIGYAPQYPTFRRDFPITVREVVSLGQLGAAVPGHAGSALEAAMVSMELEEIAGRRIATLSGGQLQRVLIARALACEPEILILDEPTANVDIRGEKNIFRLLKRYNEHMTIIVVSHDIAFISGYVRRVGCLNQTLICHRTEEISGKTIEDLYGEPVSMIHHDKHVPG